MSAATPDAVASRAFAIASVIKPSDFIGQGSRQCLDACRDIVAATTGVPANLAAQNVGHINMAFEVNKQYVPAPQAAHGIETINKFLEAGKPIVVGVSKWTGGKPYNTSNPATEHFVVIVGRGEDKNGKFYLFYDVGTQRPTLGTSRDNKLYLLQNRLLAGRTQYATSTPNYTLTEVRPYKYD